MQWAIKQWDNSDMTEAEKIEWRKRHHERYLAIARFEAQELAAMTEDERMSAMKSLVSYEEWRDEQEWSGLVEQQRIFMRARKK